MNTDSLIKVARGLKEPSLILKNAKIINTFSGEIYENDIVIYKKRIAAIGKGYEAKNTMDLKGAYVAPGFIDSHVHVESSMVSIPQYACAVVPQGTTSIITDPHEIANVIGYDGIRYMLESSKNNPLSVFFMLPSCVPATTHLETAGSFLRAFDLYPFFKEKWVLGLGEVMNVPGVLYSDLDLLDKLKIAKDKKIDGHAPGLTGKNLNAYVAAGIQSDHECINKEEALEKIRLGMYIMIREGSASKNLDDLLPVINEHTYKRCLWATDDKHPDELMEEGHINYILRKAVKNGIDPVMAIQMATINAATYFNLRYVGAIAPIYYADMVVLSGLKEFKANMVFKGGKLVAEKGHALFSPKKKENYYLRSSINVKKFKAKDLCLKALANKKCRIIKIVPDQIITEEIREFPKIENNEVIADIERDILKMYVIERHRASGNIGKGLIKGFGLKKGAFAATVAHDSHNIIAVGTNDKDILRAVEELEAIKGGKVVVADGEVKASLSLPIAGLMTDEPLASVSDSIKKLRKSLQELGVTLKAPFMTLSFLALPVIPKLKLTDKGLVDVDKFDFVDIFID